MLSKISRLHPETFLSQLRSITISDEEKRKLLRRYPIICATTGPAVGKEVCYFQFQGIDAIFVISFRKWPATIYWRTVRLVGPITKQRGGESRKGSAVPAVYRTVNHPLSDIQRATFGGCGAVFSDNCSAHFRAKIPPERRNLLSRPIIAASCKSIWLSSHLPTNSGRWQCYLKFSSVEKIHSITVHLDATYLHSVCNWMGLEPLERCKSDVSLPLNNDLIQAMQDAGATFLNDEQGCPLFDPHAERQAVITRRRAVRANATKEQKVQKKTRDTQVRNEQRRANEEKLRIKNAEKKNAKKKREEDRRNFNIKNNLLNKNG